MNIANLITLCEFLPTVPQAQFDMRTYASMEEDYDLPIDAHECKTAGCAVGWAPAAGLPYNCEWDRDWMEYSERVFDMKAGDPAWLWCFSAYWGYVDNTAAGAAKRIKHLINEGVPGNFWEQMLGRAPYIFAQELA